MEKYYIHVGVIEIKFKDLDTSKQILKALQQCGAGVDRFIDCPNPIPNGLALPDELTLKEVVLKIKEKLAFLNLYKLVKVIHHAPRTCPMLYPKEHMIIISPKSVHLTSFVQNQILSLYLVAVAILWKIVNSYQLIFIATGGFMTLHPISAS